MTWFIKPPFFQWPVKPAASRGLGDQAGPVPPPRGLALFAGSPGTAGAGVQGRGDFEYTLPASYVAGTPVQLLVDIEFLNPSGGPFDLNQIGAFIATINGDSIPQAAYSVTGFGPLPGQTLALFCAQARDPTALHLADFTFQNFYNLANQGFPGDTRQVVTIAIPGANLDTGVTSCIDFRNWGTQPTPNAGHNVNGGVIWFDGANTQAIASAPPPVGTGVAGQSYTPTIANVAGEYGFIQTLAVTEVIGNGSGAADIPGWVGLNGVPAGSVLLQPKQRVSVCLWTSGGPGANVEIRTITMRAGGVDTAISIQDVFKNDLLDSDTPAPAKVNFAPPLGAARTFWLALETEALATEAGVDITTEAGIVLRDEP